MGQVRANWHLEHLFSDDGKDPLVAYEQATIAEIGKPIDLSSDSALLRARLVELLHEEGRLDSEGVRCEIKDLPSTCCAVCPVRGSQGKLCDVGVEQATLETALVVAARGGRD